MGPNLADNLQPGERAVTVALERDRLEGAFINPGSTVDVLFRSKADAKTDVPDATVTLLSLPPRMVCHPRLKAAGTLLVV